MKISIVGMGNVGSAIAALIVSHGLADELLLVARTSDRAAGDALDLQHAAAFGQPMHVAAGNRADTAGSDVIVLAASSPDAPRGVVDRLALATANAAFIDHLVRELVTVSPSAIFLVITNPVDVITYVALKASGLPAHRVLGTGTLVDTVRFRAAISAELGIHANDIRAYILGEHGDSQFPALSVARAGGAPLGLPAPRVQAMADDARTGGYQVARMKGFPNHAVAAAAIMILEAIVRNSRIVVPVSTWIDSYLGVQDVCVSVPAVIGRTGVVRTLPVELDESETAAFRRSAAVVRQSIDAAWHRPGAIAD